MSGRSALLKASGGKVAAPLRQLPGAPDGACLSGTKRADVPERLLHGVMPKGRGK